MRALRDSINGHAALQIQDYKKIKAHVKKKLMESASEHARLTEIQGRAGEVVPRSSRTLAPELEARPHVACCVEYLGNRLIPTPADADAQIDFHTGYTKKLKAPDARRPREKFQALWKRCV